MEIKNDTVYIEGDEKNNRKIISYVIFDENPNKLMTQEILQDNFDSEDVSKMVTLLQPIVEASEVRINEFAFMNLTLHLLVLVTAVRNGRSLASENYVYDSKNILIGRMCDLTSVEIEKNLTLCYLTWIKNKFIYFLNPM